MITVKKIRIPIFDYGLHITIFDNWKELEGILPENLYAHPARGITVVYEDAGLSKVYIGSKYGSTIVHEAEHVKNEVWDFIGYRSQQGNDEVDAYLLTYIYEKIADVYYAHQERK